MVAREQTALAAIFAVASATGGHLIANPPTPAIATVARSYPDTLRLPPYVGTAVYRFRSRARFRALLESGGKLFAIASAAGGHASLLVLSGRAFGVVPMAGGPFVSLAVREIAGDAAVIAGTTGGAKPLERHFLLAHGSLTPTKVRGTGFQSLPGSGVRCLDARPSSAFNGAALIVMSQPDGALRPSISKDALSPPTDDASSNLSYAIGCHSFGQDVIVWLRDTVPTPVAGRPSGISLRAGARVTPLLDVAPVASSEHYLLFEQGDPLDATTPLVYTLVRTG